MQQGYPSVTEDEEDCARWFAEIAKGSDASAKDRHAFVRSFLRPRGLETPAAQIAADIIQKFTSSGSGRSGSNLAYT